MDNAAQLCLSGGVWRVNVVGRKMGKCLLRLEIREVTVRSIGQERAGKALVFIPFIPAQDDSGETDEQSRKGFFSHLRRLLTATTRGRQHTLREVSKVLLFQKLEMSSERVNKNFFSCQHTGWHGFNFNQPPAFPTGRFGRILRCENAAGERHRAARRSLGRHPRCSGIRQSHQSAHD